MRRLHTVFVSYNRVELTRRAVASYLDTVTLEHTAVIVDNGSNAETREWLTTSSPFPVLMLPENRYPGAATNIGFRMAPDDVDLLHRADNDFEYLPGWCDEVVARFAAEPRLGQLGLRTDEEELHAPWNVGGNAVIRAELFATGLRYDERPWAELGATTEDYYMSQAVEARGHKWGRVTRPCIRPISVESADDPYYRETWGVRGILPR
jgi:GT2 family glycosyltransferase